MIISIFHFHNYSISTREVKQVAVYAKALESCCRRGPNWLSCSVCFMFVCVREKERLREGEGDRWKAGEAYSHTVFLVMAN